MLDNDPNDTTDTETGAQMGTQTDAGAGPATTPDPAPVTQDGPDTPGTDTDPADQNPDEKPARKTAAKKAAKAPAKKAAAKKTAKKAAKVAEPAPDAASDGAADVAVDAPAEKPKKTASRKRAAAKPPATDETPTEATEATDASAPAAPMVLFKAPEPTTAPRKRAARKTAAKPAEAPEETAAEAPDEATATEPEASEGAAEGGNRGRGQGKGKGGNRNRSAKGGPSGNGPETPEAEEDTSPVSEGDEQDESDEDTTDGEGGARRRRRRGGRRRRKPSDGENGENDEQSDESEETGEAEEPEGDTEGTGSRRRRRRRRTGDEGNGSGDSEGTTSRARKPRNPEDEITSIGGSTRLEAKKQRRREGREAGRRRAPIVSEAEFLARRESVDRVMVIRQKDDLTQIGVLEDKVLVEHYVARESQTSLIGNVYLGRVQNVLPSMEAAFIDIGKGRNAVLYAGEVNWAALGHKDGQQRKIESVLSSGQTILVQVTKDPVGHKGARLTGQVSLPGRFLVYVPDGNTSGISRKLPDTERNRLKTLLKQIVPDSAGVIVRTAAEGASEEELTLDVERLTARWADIEEKVKAGKSPQLLYGEPDLTLKVVRDLFTEDFGKLVVQGNDAWDLVDNYVEHVAPDLQDRLERFEPNESGKDLFATYRVDEQIAKGLDRKVWLPSGGSLIIDRTEAMTVVDVNTGKFTGSGGNLEETVTKNNLEAAEEMVRQLRLRDIGGIIVIDFIDMVLESNRDLVLRRLVECLGRDRTRHQVAEVTSLGLVQMTRKRIGTGLLEAFSTECEHCKGRGLITHDHPVEAGQRADDDEPRGRRSRGGRSRGGRGAGEENDNNRGGNGGGAPVKPSPADLANTRKPEKHADDETESGEEQSAPAHTPDERAPGTDGGRPAASSPAAEPEAEQSVIGRPAGSMPEPQRVPSESGAAEEPAAPEPAPVVEAPRAVTSTRRRTARRPAGPPSPVAEMTQTGSPQTESTASLGAGRQATPSAEPVDIPVEPAAPGHAPLAEPDPRAESEGAAGIRADPTWPDGSDRAETESSQRGGEEGDEHGDEYGDGHGDLHGGEDGDEDSGSASSLRHVPIKRKGSRKR